MRDDIKLLDAVRRRRPTIERLEARELLAVDVQVAPFDHQQTFLGGGAGFTLYSGHLVNGVPSSQRETVYDWLFEDLNLRDLRIFSFRGEANGNDNADPFDLDLAAMEIPARDTEFTIYQEAIERNPHTRVMAYANTLPPHLTNEDGHHDISKPNFYAEYAEYLYANLVITKQRYGVQIDMIDLLNEPDLQGKVPRAEGALIFANTVPLLRQMVADNYAEYGVEMPLITGPSNLTARGGASWLSDWEANEPNTWAEIDVLATHLYGGSGFDPENYETIADLRDADHPIFIQNEMEFGHSSFVDNGRLPDDALENDLEGALALARATAIALDAGADGFHVFQGVNPNSSGAKSLVHTPWGQTAVRRKGHFVYQQMTALQPFESDVVSDTTTGAPEGYHTYAYNQYGDNRVYVNVVNTNATQTETTSLSFRDNQGGVIPFKRVTDYATDAVNDMAILSDEAFASPITQWTADVAPNSVRTFVVELTQTAHTVPVGDLTYVREANSFSSTPQDGDANPRTEFLVGYNGPGDAGTGRGIMRGLFEFDLSGADLPADQAIESARLELRAYRGAVGTAEDVAFELNELLHDFNEPTATWVDPDGDGSPATGEPTPGGALGPLLSTSLTYSGASEDYNANGDTEIFHQRVELESSPRFVAAVEAARQSELRLALSPLSAVTTNADFFGFFDEESDYAPELIVVTASADNDGPTVTEAYFNHQTDKRIGLTFSEPIDTQTLEASDFIVTNLTANEVLDPNSLILQEVTPSGAKLLIRSSVMQDADWEIAVPSGVFQDVAGNGNSGGFAYRFFELSGDANRDRSVDAADYTIYRDTLGSTSDLRANADNSGASAGVIDAADRVKWLANYGAELEDLPPSLVTIPVPQAKAPAFVAPQTLLEETTFVTFAASSDEDPAAKQSSSPPVQNAIRATSADRVLLTRTGYRADEREPLSTSEQLLMDPHAHTSLEDADEAFAAIGAAL